MVLIHLTTLGTIVENNSWAVALFSDEGDITSYVSNLSGWHHVAVVADDVTSGSTVSLYVDGALSASGTLNRSIASLTNFAVANGGVRGTGRAPTMSEQRIKVGTGSLTADDIAMESTVISDNATWLGTGVYNAPSATTWTLTYNGNGNDGGTAPTDASSPYDDGSTVTVLGNTGLLTLTGYTWSGWNTASDGTGTSYAESDTFTISADTTLYAVWTLDVQTITGVTYDKDGNIEPSCQVTLLSMTAGVPTAVVETVTSDATTGAFSFTVADDTLDYQVVAHLDGTPNTFDVSDNELTAVTGGTDTYLYLRSQADKTDISIGGLIILSGLNGGF